MKKKWWWIGGLVIAVGLGGSAFWLRRGNFEYTKPWRGEITEAVYGLGKVKTRKRFEVILGVVSTVSKRFVNEGQLVEKGAPLIEFESKALFRAPFRGTVTLVSLYDGETAIPHTTILRLEDLEQRYIEVSLEQQAVLRVKRGLPAQVSFESLRGKTLSGEVSAVFPREDEFMVHVAVNGLDPQVMPGMTADVSIEVGKIADALLVPLKAVKGGMVSVKRGRAWKNVRVQIGHVDGLSAELLGNTISVTDEIRLPGGG